MQTPFIIYSVSFVVVLILLFYFIAKYREAEVKDNGEELDFPDGEESAASAAPAQQDTKRIFGLGSGASAREVADLKEKFKELHYRIEEIKLLEEKRANELSKLISAVEQRVSTFENEYVQKLQPTLYSLINELENIQNKTKN